MARGAPELPLSWADLEATFLENARAAIRGDVSRAVISEVHALDTRPSLRPLLDLVSGRAAPPTRPM